jgi:hypothetical protein
VIASFIPGDMIFCNNPAALVHKDPAFDTQRVNFEFQDPGINEYAASNTEFRILIDKTGRNHSDAIFTVSDLDSVSCIRTHTAAGDDCGFILEGNVGNDLALALIPKKSTNDDSAAHISFM